MPINPAIKAAVRRLSPAFRRKYLKAASQQGPGRQFLRQEGDLLESVLQVKDSVGKPIVDKAWHFGAGRTKRAPVNKLDVAVKMRDGDVATVLNDRELLDDFLKLKLPPGHRLNIVPITDNATLTAAGSVPSKISEIKGALTKGRQQFGPGYKWYRIMAVPVAAGAGVAATSEDAEAFPLPKPTRQIKTALKGVLSSATRVLKGKEFRDHGVIWEVRKGPKDSRIIVMNSGKTFRVTKDYVSQFASRAGTQKYLDSFQTKKPKQQFEQAWKSLMIRYSKSTGFASKEPQMRVVTKWLEETDELMGRGVPQVMVKYKGKKFPMPEPYARLLNQKTEGQVRILVKTRMPKE